METADETIQRQRVRDAAPAMLDVLKLVAENENGCACVCSATACHFNADYHTDKTMKALGITAHEYVSPDPCLGCQVESAISLATKGE